MDEEIQRAAELISEADALLITAGAGVDSGLPDFRGNEGFWNAYPPYRKLGRSFIEMANSRSVVIPPLPGDSTVTDLTSIGRRNRMKVFRPYSSGSEPSRVVPRNLPGAERKMLQIRWSSDLLFQVLSEREPDHPLLEQAVHEVTHTFLDTNRAIEFLETALELDWILMEVPAVSPFAFGLYASKIKEGMMMDSHEEAIERLYREMQRKLGREVEE